MNVPDAVGVPLMVIVFDPKEAVTPAGKLVGVPMPVAPVVVKVIGAASAVLIQSVGEDDEAPTVLFGVTVTFLVSVLVSVQIEGLPRLLLGCVIGKITET